MIYRPASYIDRLNLCDLFPSQQPLELELGAGDGSFLIAWAKANPQHNFVGIERLLGRIRKIERKANRAGLTNLRLMRVEASYFLEYLLPRRSITALHIYFPDPWPKRRHWKNRLINDAFAETCTRALAPRGTIFLRTDDAHYFAQMQSVLKSFTAVPTPPALSTTLTDFERTFHKRGVRILTAAYSQS